MNSRLIRLAFSLGVTLAAVSALADAETLTSTAATTNVIGLMNFKTGAFTPLPRAMSGGAATEGGAYDGWVVANISAANKSRLPTTDEVICELFWTAFDSEANAYTWRLYFARAQVKATTISCTVKMPYVLHATNQNAVTISIYPFLYVTPDKTRAPGSGKPTTASVEVPSVSFTLPAPGSTTVRDFSTYF